MDGPAATLTQALFAALTATESRPSLDIHGGVTDAAAVSRLTARRSAELAAAGLAPKMRVMVPSGQGVASLIDMLAVWLSGGVVVPYDPGMSPAVAEVMVATTDPALIVESGPAMKAADCAVPRLHPPEMLASGVDGEGLRPPEVTPDDLSAILFTSGSTGRPKGVALSHRALLGNVRAVQRILTLRPGDRLFMAIPFHFTSAIHHFLTAVLSGAVFVATEKPLLQGELYDAVRGADATCFGGAPLQLRWLAEVAAKKGPLALKWAMSSGDHLSVDVIGLWAAHQPETAVHTVYGLTEVGGRFCFLDPARLPAKAGSVGRPIDGLEVSIRDDVGHEVTEPGVEGEIMVTGDWLFDGYYRNPEETAAALCDGVFRTGDLGFVDPDGCVYVTGRTDDVFKSAGQKVSVVPIAATLMETGLFDDVAVWPVEHPAFGKVPHVFYALKEGAVFERGHVMRALRANLPSNHLPRGFEPVASVPRTASGKIRRDALRHLAAEVEAGMFIK